MQAIFVGSHALLAGMNEASAGQPLRLVVDWAFSFDELRAALRHLKSAADFGEIALRR